MSSLLAEIPYLRSITLFPRLFIFIQPMIGLLEYFLHTLLRYFKSCVSGVIMPQSRLLVGSESLLSGGITRFGFVSLGIPK